MSSELEKAYRYCESVTKNHAKSFYFAARFLPFEKRRAVYPIYAFCRHVDDEIDEIGESDEATAVATVEKWRENLRQVFEDKRIPNSKFQIPDLGNRIPDSVLQVPNLENQKLDSSSPDSETNLESGIWNLESTPNLESDEIANRKSQIANQKLVFLAWQDVLKTYDIPENLPLELVEGVLMDTRIKRYQTFDELYVYCYRVASTVGLMSSEILGYADKSALKLAEAMGIAMQLTNILRDIGEDAAIGRIYLPQEDLRAFNVTEEQIFANRFDANFERLMRFQIERAREFYETGTRGIALLARDSRFTVLLAARIYAQILDEIEKQNYNVFTKRAHTSRSRKLLSIPKIWLASRSL